jgi:hypothetical protein
MPKLLERLRGQLEARGLPRDKAYAVATKKLQESGNLKPGSVELTSKGKKRTAMGAEGRAKDRAAKYSGHNPSEFVYSKKTNRATLKDCK